MRLSTKNVPEHAPATVRASSCCCVAPSGRSAATFGPCHRLPMRLPTHVRRWWSRRCICSRPAATSPLWGASRGYTRSSSLSPHTNVPGCRCTAFHDADRHVCARSSSSHGVLPRLLRVLPTQLYWLRAWPLLAITIPAYTFCPLRLRRQHHRLVLDQSTSTTTNGIITSLHRSASRNRSGASSASLPGMEQSSY
jgi:hypothetical protein